MVVSPLEQFEIVVAPFPFLQFLVVLFLVFVVLYPQAALILKRWVRCSGYPMFFDSVPTFLRRLFGFLGFSRMFIGYAWFFVFGAAVFFLFFQFCLWQYDTPFFSSLSFASVFLLIVLAAVALEFGLPNNLLVPSAFSVFGSQLFCFVHNLVVDHVPNHPKVGFGARRAVAHFWAGHVPFWQVQPSFRWVVFTQLGAHGVPSMGSFYTGNAKLSFFTLLFYRRFRLTLRRCRRTLLAVQMRFLHFVDLHPVYFISSLFFFVLCANMLGMVPYSFAVTSQLIITFTLSFVAFIGLNIFAIRDNGWHFLDLFLPTGVPLFLAPFVILIEVISYVARVFSLGIRLFANIMAGHTLLKILAGFILAAGVALFQANPLLVPLFGVPVLLFGVVTVLEFAIAFLQAYVFTVLVCLYINDVYSIGSH